MGASNVPMQKWTTGIFLYINNLKGIFSMKLPRDLRIGQSAAWFMSHRFREVFSDHTEILSGTVEVDETLVDGMKKNKHKSKKLNAGRGGAGKSIVVGVKERDLEKVNAKVIENTQKDALHDFINDDVESDSTVNTDDFNGCKNLHGYERDIVKHSVGEHVSKQTNAHQRN